VEKNPNTPEDVLINIQTREEKWAEELGFKNAYEEKQLR
jgi:hypothetical protein